MTPTVRQLVEAYAGQNQPPAAFKPRTWSPLLAPWPAAESILWDDRYTKATENGRRTVDRQALRRLVSDSDLDDPKDVISAFTLIVVWGSGVRSRSYRNLPRALGQPDCVEQLTSAAQSCRRGDLAAAHRISLAGVGPAYFTKWFAFGGYSAGMEQNPLILDARVWRSLNHTLGIHRNDLAHRASLARRYVAYVELLHRWADELTGDGLSVDAERIEFVLFNHNGRELPAPTST